MSETRQHFEILGGHPADVLAIAAHGRLTTEDYEKVLIPAFEEKLRAEGKVKLLFVFGDDFGGYSAGAAWDDAKFGLLHLRDIARTAIVTDLDWLRLAVKALAPMMACPVALFHLSEMDEASAWIDAWRQEEDGKPEADAEPTILGPQDTA